jgi:hypothetical protein
MSTLENIERLGTAAVGRLRRQKLSNGIPFMINSKDLPPDQCYLEFPDGSIKLTALLDNNRDFTMIRTLDEIESRQLRRRFNLRD